MAAVCVRVNPTVSQVIRVTCARTISVNPSLLCDPQVHALLFLFCVCVTGVYIIMIMNLRVDYTFCAI